MMSNICVRGGRTFSRYNAVSMRRSSRPPRRTARPILRLSIAFTTLLCGVAFTAAGDDAPKGPAATRTGRPGKRSGRSAIPVLRWPMERPGAVLSSFGEYRYDHLHAGIDISTGGGTGLKVLAAAAGEVFRLKVEWRGYGRALYLRHPGGRVTVYGHLERYEDKVLGLERLVSQRQAQAGTRYPGDIYLERPLRVTRGQVIAYSGESGVGLPHLHFEVRDGGDAPLDPFLAGLPRPSDSRPPVLEALTVTAASASTFVEGDAREVVYPLRPGLPGTLTSSNPIRVSGPFLAVLSAFDPAGATGRAGVGGVEVTIDGGVRYRLALHSFRFDQYAQAGLIFDHRSSRLGPAAFGYRLNHLPGNDLGTGPLDAPAPAEGVYPGAIDLPPGFHRMEITVEDAASNRSRAGVCIQVGRPKAVEAIDWDGRDGGSVGVRFRLSPAEASGDPAGHGADPSACSAPSRDVQAEFWDDRKRAFSALTCRMDDGVCTLPPVLDRGAVSAVRLRETRNGVPGPWRLLSRDTATVPPAESLPVDVDAWPAFLDVLASLEGPAVPPLRLASGLDHSPLETLTYRDGLFCGTGLAYTRAAGLAPFFIVADSSPTPVASLALDVRWVEPGRPVDYRGPGFSLHLPEKARFFPGPLALRTERTPGTDRLPSISDAIEILPEGEALDERGVLAFELSPDAVAAETLGIYRWDPFHRRWSYEGGDLEEGGTRLSLHFRRYGRFALLQDASPPEILEVVPAPGSRSTKRRPSISARVEDQGKGLNYDGVTFELDGRRLESEFDPDRGISKVLDPPSLPLGKHHLKVVAVDLAGNASQPSEADFEVLQH